MNYVDAANLNQLWARLLIEELVRNGVRHFCCAPGSRNAPLSLAAAENPGAELMTHFDERGLAFHALGYAQATGKPAVALCTSGSAAANFWPAAVEAAQSRLPLILITADRPPELLGSGANQAIDQCKLFGDYARATYHLPCPTRDIAPEFLLTTIDEAVHRAMRAPAGPVHINCQFREPLVSPSGAGDEHGYPDNLADWSKSDWPYTHWNAPTVSLGEDVLSKMSAIVAFTGIVEGRTFVPPNDMDVWLVVGRLSREKEVREVKRFAEMIGWPTFPDVLSGLRTGTCDAHWVHQYDALLLSEQWRKACPPRVVLHLGGPITSKRLLSYIERVHPVYIHVSDSPIRQDPNNSVSTRYEADVAEFCAQFSEHYASPQPEVSKQWAEELAVTSARVKEAIDTFLSFNPALTEIHVARIVSRLRPEGAPIFLGNSMPIRDMDRFADGAGPAGRIYANRGASGIDGNLATAAAHARAQSKPLTVVIGDMAALHDLNSLALYRGLETPVALIVINNDGGGIFSFLPVAKFPEHFETCLGTPHGIRFEAAAKLFGLPYAAPETPGDFEAAYRNALESPGASLIEVRTNREENVRLHQSMDEAIRQRLGEPAS